MPYSVILTQTPTDMVDELNGVLRAPNVLQVQQPLDDVGDEEVFEGLNGLTLEFNVPVVTVTFASADPVTLSQMLTELNTQVQVADPNFVASIENAKTAPGTTPPAKRLKMSTTTAAGLTIDLDPATSTAAERLGFPRATGRTLSKAPIDRTTIVTAGDSISGSLYIILNT